MPIHGTTLEDRERCAVNACPGDNEYVGFTRAQLESFRNAEVPDLVGPGLRLLFVGINPGLWTAATQTPFAHPGNRFYPALAEAGIIPRLPSFAAGLSEADRQEFLDAGIGISNLVKRATVRADELSRDELRAGAARLTRDVARWKPVVVAIVGLTAYRQGFGHSKARAGKQPEHLAESELWVVPNPSGLNAHDTIASLAEAYAEPARAAGILMH
jgi:double-stranded uracil-DNA glycosylase